MPWIVDQVFASDGEFATALDDDTVAVYYGRRARPAQTQIRRILWVPTTGRLEVPPTSGTRKNLRDNWVTIEGHLQASTYADLFELLRATVQALRALNYGANLRISESYDIFTEDQVATAGESLTIEIELRAPLLATAPTLTVATPSTNYDIE